jgi:hypothetical protein
MRKEARRDVETETAQAEDTLVCKPEVRRRRRLGSAEVYETVFN